jgi:transposase-like protein
MTDAMMDLRSLLEKGPPMPNLSREMIGLAAKRLMGLEVAAVTNTAWGERDPARLVQRNGYRGRSSETRAGGWSCTSRSSGRAPTSRASLHPRRLVEKTLMAVIQEAYVHGLTTRAVDDLVRRWARRACPRSRVEPALRRDRRAGAGVPQPSGSPDRREPVARRISAT